jgi:hypothetical protein
MNDDGCFTEIEAAFYDADHGSDPEAIEATTAFLAALAGDGPALEFAIGTGRIALPLAERGVTVKGVELSKAMVTRLREKPRGADIEVTIGDMSTTRVPGKFSLVYLVFNTISNLTTQRAQVACFKNAAAHLNNGGVFVVENAVPPLQRLPSGETRIVFDRSDRHWGVDEMDTVTQNAVSHHIWLDGTTVRRFSMPFRWVWPSELDLMAAMAGLELAERWGSWSRDAFTNRSVSHVSVWRKTSN